MKKQTETARRIRPKTGEIISIAGGDIPAKLLDDVRRMIEEARAAVAAAVNTGLTMLY